jgi:hypothetical protein
VCLFLRAGTIAQWNTAAIQARCGPSLSIILTAGGGPGSPGREVAERITPYVVVTQTVTDGPTYCRI